MSHQYAVIADLTNLGIPETALSSFDDAQKNDALTAASDLADGWLATKHPTPLTTYPRSLTIHVARMAVYILMTARGMNPNAGGNELIIKGNDDAMKWLAMVSKGMVVLPSTTTAPAGTSVPQIISTPSRYG